MKDVAEAPEVQRAVDEACERWPRAGEAWDALTWALSRDPELGTALNEQGTVRAVTLEGARAIGLPTLTARYRVEAYRVMVERVRFTDAASPIAGHA